MDKRSPFDYANLPVDRRRHDTIVPEAGADPYREVRHYPGGTVCAGCGLIYEEGRWAPPEAAWAPPPAHALDPDATPLCPACRRIRDDYPAGFLAATGAFVRGHLAEVLDVVRRNAELELAEHPLNRIMRLDTADGRVDLTTTDIHLARRIGEALHDLYGGEIDLDYLKDGEQLRVKWTREDLPVREAPAPTREPLAEVVTHDIDLTPEVLDYLWQRIRRLPEFYERIIASRIVVRGETRHHRTGGPFSVHIHIQVPQRVVSVTRQQRDDLHVAIREAFDAAQRQLEDLARRQRGEESPTVRPLRGRILRLFPGMGYGFIESPDGDVYFHRNAVLDGRFDDLSVGDVVRYEVEPGDAGLQASTVALPGD